MEESVLQQPELIGRDYELSKLKKSLDKAIEGNNTTLYIAGEAGIGKTRLVSELKKYAEEKHVNIIQGWCLAESLEPLMPIKTALREAGLYHLVSGDSPPMVVSAYLMNEAGMLIAQTERKESDLDPDIFAGMLQAVGNFVQDSLSMMDGSGDAGLNSLGYGDYTILIQSNGNLSLATVIKGTNSEFLIEDMINTLNDIGNKFDNWNGEKSSTKEVVPKITWFVDSGRYDGKFLVDDPKIKQENLFDNILLGLQRASAKKPILLFLDDLQWTDTTTLNLVHYLSRNIRDNRIIILGTYRPEDILEESHGTPHHLETSMQGMTRESLLEKIELKRLDAENTEKIINSMLDVTSFEESFFEKIYKETDGSPFFILEVVKLLVEDGAIEKNKDGIWYLIGELDEISIPSKVYDVVKKRLNRLEEDPYEILELASVMGEEFDSDIIQKITETSKLRLLKIFSGLEKKHQLIKYQNDRYRFDHSKIREVLYSGIGEELRKEYHRMVADIFLDTKGPDSPDILNELAHHFFEARDERAEEWLIKAGDSAREAYTIEEAIKYYRNALEVSHENKNSILERIGDSHFLVSDYDKALKSYEEISTSDPEIRASVLRKIGGIYYYKGDFDESLSTLQEAEAMIENRDSSEFGRLCIAMGYTLWKSLDLAQAETYLMDGLDILEKHENTDKDIGDALRMIGNLYLTNKNYDDAIDYYNLSLEKMKEIEDLKGIAGALANISIITKDPDISRDMTLEALEIVYKIKDKFLIANILNLIASSYLKSGNLDESLKYFISSIDIKEKIGDRYGIAASMICIGTIHCNSGNIEKGMESLIQSEKIFSELDNQRETMRVRCQIGHSLILSGDLDEAEEILLSSYELEERKDNMDIQGHSRINLGYIEFEKGNYEEALAYYLEALKLFENNDMNGYFEVHYALSALSIAQGNIPLAKEYSEKASELMKEINQPFETALYHEIMGMIYVHEKEWEKAENEFTEALKAFSKVVDKRYVPQTLFRYSEMFIKKGEPDKAREHLEKALSEFQRMGMKLWEERARNMLTGIE